MSTKYLALLLLACLMITPTLQRDYSEIYNAYCTPEYYNSVNITVEDRLAMRSSQQGVYISVKSVIDVIQNQSVSNIMKEAGAYIILMIILTVACLISFIVFLAYCCCCDRHSSGTVRKSKLYVFLTCLFIVVFTALFIALLVFLGKLNTNQNSTGCAIASIPHDLIDGATYGDLKFLGFKPLTDLLMSFKNELSSITTLSKDFDAIIAQDLGASSKAALNSLPAFYNKFKDSTTNDGTGTAAKPMSVQTLTQNVNDAIFTEFSIYDQVSTKITEAAQTGKGYANSGSITSIQTSLDEVANQLSSLTTQISSVFGTAVTGIDYFNQYAPIGYWITLGLGLLIFILGYIAVVILICMIRKHNDYGRMGVKFCLSFNGFLIFILGILAIILLVASISLGTVCHAVGEVLTSTDVATTINAYGVEMDDFVNKIINQCLPAGSSGDVTTLITGNTDAFSGSKTFLDGLSLYDALKANMTQAGDSSPTINATVSVWADLKTSYWPDQANAVVSLNQLNNLVSCGDQRWELNSKNCTSTSGCQGVYGSSSFSAPTCSSNSAQATTLYNNLKQFTQDEDSLLGNMISSLSGADANTPLSLNNANKSKIKSVFTSFDNIKSKLQSSIDKVSSFNNGLAANLNCTILRREIDNLESTFCFKFNQSLYYFAVLLIWIVFFLFFYSWCICYALRYMPNAEADIYSQKVANETAFYRDEEQKPIY